MTAAILPAIDRSIKFDRETKDYRVEVDGQFIGYARTYDAGEALANEHVYDLMERGLISDDPRDHAGAVAQAEEITDVLPSAEVVTETIQQILTLTTVPAAYVRAFRKATAALARGVYPRRDGNDWLVQGSTNSTYRVRETGCTCAAGKRGWVCYHAALVEAVERSIVIDYWHVDWWDFDDEELLPQERAAMERYLREQDALVESLIADAGMTQHDAYTLVVPQMFDLLDYAKAWDAGARFGTPSFRS